MIFFYSSFWSVPTPEGISSCQIPHCVHQLAANCICLPVGIEQLQYSGFQELLTENDNESNESELEQKNVDQAAV